MIGCIIIECTIIERTIIERTIIEYAIIEYTISITIEYREGYIIKYVNVIVCTSR
jgi:hypothetical protein